MTELNQHPRRRPAPRRHESLYGAEALSALPIEDQIRQLCITLPAETGWHIITEYSGGVLRLGQIRVHMGSGSYELMLRTAFCHQDQRDAPHLPDDEGAEYSFTLVADELFYSDAAGSGRPSWSDESLYRAQAILTFIGTVYEAHRREVKSTYRAAETMGRVTELYPPGIERQDSPLMYIAGNKIVDGIRLCRVMRKGLATKHARAASKEMETWLTSCVDNPVVSVDDIQAELSRLLRACVDEGLVPDEYFHLKTLLKSPEPDQATTQVG